MEDKFSKIKKLAGYDSSKQLITESIKELKPTKKNLVGLFSSIIISLVLSLIMGFNEETVGMFRELSQIIFNTALAIFGIIFTVFTIFQALLSDDFIKVLLYPYPQGEGENIDDSETYLSVNYVYFEHMVVCYLFAAIIDLIIYFCVLLMPDNYILTGNFLLNNVLASSIITIYLSFNIWILLELFSVIFNVSKLLRIYLMNKAKNNHNDD